MSTPADILATGRMEQLMRLSNTIDAAQAYFMLVAENYKEVTVTIKNEMPYVTVFLGKGPEAPIGMGESIAAALFDAINSQE